MAETNISPVKPGIPISLIECPRDAMQGLGNFISTQKKITYIQSLLDIGFDIIDCGSFVAPKVIPQMADSFQVLNGLDISSSSSRLLTIVANERGAEQAIQFEKVTYLGFPFSISETFQIRNTRKTTLQSMNLVKEIQEICQKNGKDLVIYFSMGLGNPYGDPYHPDMVIQWAGEMDKIGVKNISLADTIGTAVREDIQYLFSYLIPGFPKINWGAHFHSRPDQWKEKINAAYSQGCRRFDSTLGGFGGCPMAGDKLVGNMATENLIEFFKSHQEPLSLREDAMVRARLLAADIFL